MLDNLQRKIAEYKLNKTKENLIKSIDDNIYSSQENINSSVEILTDFKKNKYSKHDSFFNLCIFSDLVNIDLTILLEKFRLANRIQEKKLYARVIALTIVDFLDNINVLIGRDCLEELKKNNMNEFLDEFKIIHKKFSTFKKANDRLLRDIRNNTIAHKSKDALKLNEQLNKLDEEKVYEFGLELKTYSREFVDLSSAVISYIIDYMKEKRKI